MSGERERNEAPGLVVDQQVPRRRLSRRSHPQVLRKGAGTRPDLRLLLGGEQSECTEEQGEGSDGKGGVSQDAAEEAVLLPHPRS